MKFINTKKIAITTTTLTLLSTVVNAAVEQSEAITRSLGDWMTIVAEIVAVLCLVIFAIYMGRYLTVKADGDSEENKKILSGTRNGIMTSIVGIALCQALIIVSQLCF